MSSTCERQKNLNQRSCQGLHFRRAETLSGDSEYGSSEHPSDASSCRSRKVATFYRATRCTLQDSPMYVCTLQKGLCRMCCDTWICRETSTPLYRHRGLGNTQNQWRPWTSMAILRDYPGGVWKVMKIDLFLSLCLLQASKLLAPNSSFKQGTCYYLLLLTLEWTSTLLFV